MNIFNNPYKTTETWTSQGAIIEYYVKGQNAEAVPLMIAGLNLTFSRQKASYYPLNQNATGGATKINVNGAPQGALGITAIYCPTPGKIKEFLEKAARDCVQAGEELVVTIRPFGNVKCGNTTVTEQQKFELTGVELVTLGLTIQSAEVTIVNMPLQFQFTDLDYNEKGND